MQSLFILGRQPALGLAELESLYGGAPLRQISPQAALLDAEPGTVDFARLGGSVKFGRVLTTFDTTDWDKLEKSLVTMLGAHADYLPENKLSLGLSVYGFSSGRGRYAAPTRQRLLATGLTLKKTVKQTGRSVRLVPNKELELNSASVLHNNLTGPNGWELLLVRDGQQTIVAQTLRVQDIDSYTDRDRGRPKRDARVGMLPPKLAQIIINLAAGSREKQLKILDPFCGTGVVLQEAILMGYDALGSDIDPRMIEYSEANIKWLLRSDSIAPVSLEVGDATTYTWGYPGSFDAVACETYLGRPFTSSPSPDILAQTIADCNQIIKKFLQNISSQIAPGTRLCLAVPAWQSRPGQFKHLPLLSRSTGVDSLADMGYNRISFEHVRDDQLIYFREDQIVARELLVLEKR